MDGDFVAQSAASQRERDFCLGGSLQLRTQRLGSRRARISDDFFSRNSSPKRDSGALETTTAHPLFWGLLVCTRKDKDKIRNPLHCPYSTRHFVRGSPHRCQTFKNGLSFALLFTGLTPLQELGTSRFISFLSSSATSVGRLSFWCSADTLTGSRFTDPLCSTV